MTRPTHNHIVTAPSAHEVWPVLAKDEPIALVNERGWRLSGRVETLSRDRQCLWIQLDAGLGRQLIHHQDGFVLENERPAG
ncbi:hypothetical protein [Arthrobacter sp.]|uniref:hypothetical protein n=1 Tax=Arthrobacter sp. TaxID=1667 RepID=UPI0026DF5C6D|nr:hypothetical protein [Arthrobacter sp.]MDO5753910.1 hypothetical protein [Arthrobacter sp.]